MKGDGNMPEYIRKGERVHCVEYSYCYELIDTPGSGYRFPCDEHGNVKIEGENMDGARENYRLCKSGAYPVRDVGVKKSEWSYWRNAIIRCGCGEEVELYINAEESDCPKCGQLYNSFGQALRCRARDVDYLDAGERYDDDY
jgi:predicted RNA-binding Zn-ribbon protein involved in translation (DUF1610 family)